MRIAAFSLRCQKNNLSNYKIQSAAWVGRLPVESPLSKRKSKMKRQEQRKAGGPLLWVEEEKRATSVIREKEGLTQMSESEANHVGKYMGGGMKRRLGGKIVKRWSNTHSLQEQLPDHNIHFLTAAVLIISLGPSTSRCFTFSCTSPTFHENHDRLSGILGVGHESWKTKGSPVAQW